ncbi:MAG: hypothetical protein A4E35_01550 [Methanoregula sp. PtaU1.Bin051]|nr:MAG: hypothetical protein A4E35_01550 [Methanoregula sp. PtaU1.Bin051]
MKITRLYSGKGGHSYFEDIELEFTMKEDLGLFTEPVGAKAVFFREIPPEYAYTWHTVVCREYVVTLSGSAEIEASSGEKREFAKGDVLLAEDLTGKGHRTRCTSRMPWRQIFVTLP